MRLEIAADVKEGRRARAAVEIFVATADGQIGAVRAEVDRDRAGRMAEIPQRQRPRRPRRGGEPGHVGARGGAVMDVGEEQDGGIVVDGLDDAAQRRGADARAGQQGGEPLCDVEVGREIAGLGEDGAPRRPGGEAGGEQLEQVDAR